MSPLVAGLVGGAAGAILGYFAAALMAMAGRGRR